MAAVDEVRPPLRRIGAELVLPGLVVVAVNVAVVRAAGFLEQRTRYDLGSLPFYGLWMLLAAAWSLAVPDDARVPLRIARARGSWGSVAILAAIVVASMAMYSQSVTRVAHGQVHPPRVLGPFLGGGVVGPVVEEWIFRGLLWNRCTALLPKRAGRIVAVLWTSIVFGLWHLPFEQQPQPVVHAVFGALMAMLRWRFDSILPACVIHAVGNSLWHFTA